MDEARLITKRWRKKKPRSINYTPSITTRTPDTSTHDTLPVRLHHDELEAIRLKYINKLGIITGAKQMKISKSLFAKIVNEGLGKIAHSLIYGKPLEIELGQQTEPKESLPL